MPVSLVVLPIFASPSVREFHTHQTITSVTSHAMLKIRRSVFITLYTLLLIGQVHAATPLTDSREDAGESGTVLQYVVPVTALALTFVLDGPSKPNDLDLNLNFNTDRLIHLDGSPRHDLALAFGRSLVLTQTLKYAVNETRPDGGSHSFPSGHTAAAFTGAEFIRKEYGWWWGIPAYAMATYVGWSRVDAREHYAHDVLAGAAIGILVNHDFRELHTRYGALSFAPATLPSGEHSVMGLQFNLQF